MNWALLQRLDEAFSQYPSLCAGPAPDTAVHEIDQYAGFSVPDDYRLFVKRYGGALVGPYAIYGWGRGHAMGDNETSVVEVTERFRSRHWPGTENALVVSIDHTGNPIVMDRLGHVSCIDHTSSEVRDLALSFENFLTQLAAKLR